MGSFTPNAHRATAYKHINPGILNTVLERENFALLNSAIVTNWQCVIVGAQRGM